MEVVPPSTSFAPAEPPNSRAVTRSLVPLKVVPSCVTVVPEVACSGSPRSHWPVVAVSVPFGLVVHPWLVSKSSKKTVTGPGPVTVSDMAALCDSEPLVPLTWKLVVPVGVVPDTFTVNVLLALPPDGGVTDDGTKLQVAPLGRPVHDRLTALLKPFCEVTVQVLVALPPWAAVRLDGLQASVKSGVTEAAGVTVRQVLARPKQALEAPAAT